MTPRALSNEVGSIHEQLGIVLARLVEDLQALRDHVSAIDGLLAMCARAVVEHPERRLVTVRAYLDAAEERRSDAVARVRRARSLGPELDLDEKLIYAGEADVGMSSLIARGAAAAERDALYALRAKATVKRLSDVRSVLTELFELERHIHTVIRSIDSHRLEALSMSRAGFSFSGDEYAVLRSTSP